MIVVDASVLANAVGDDGDRGAAARDALHGADGLIAPDLVDVEALAALRKQWLSASLSEERYGVAVDLLQQWDFARVPAQSLIKRASELRASVTSYDAMYVALAEALDCELLTADRRLANANGPRCRIRLLR